MGNIPYHGRLVAQAATICRHVAPQIVAYTTPVTEIRTKK
jgi:hypothetical protein